MSKAASSPTARLLQSSRLFSLPRPLPAPPLESITSQGVYRASDTATLPYPTLQAITTTSTSLHRGDWGLKRPLPGKTTRHTSTPHIRVQAQDTAEHITDFASAADHTQSRAKWQEMQIPMIHRASRNRTGSESKGAPLSVFEDFLDNTTSESASAEPPSNEHALAQSGETGSGNVKEARLAKQRWKFDGPWLAGMQEGEFRAWLTTISGKRKGEWREYLRNEELEKRFADVQRRARNEGEVLSEEQTKQLRTLLRPSDKELHALEKRLRDDHATQGLSSDLTTLICDFLDLPSVQTSDMQPAKTWDARIMRLAGVSSAEDAGPPSTHPAAGLSHLRTKATMENHPLHGPQAHRSPVLSRVVRPRKSNWGRTEYQACVGVGGFVALDSATATHDPDRSGRGARVIADADRMTDALDPDLPGGNKLWVHPENAFVDEKGRVRLAVSRGDRESIAVKTGDVEPIHRAKASSVNGPSVSGLGAAGTTSAGFGGLGTRSWTRPVGGRGRFSGAIGFDEEMARQPQQGKAEGQTPAGKIREIIDRGKM